MTRPQPPALGIFYELLPIYPNQSHSQKLLLKFKYDLTSPASTGDIVGRLRVCAGRPSVPTASALEGPDWPPEGLTGGPRELQLSGLAKLREGGFDVPPCLAGGGAFGTHKVFACVFTSLNVQLRIEFN